MGRFVFFCFFSVRGWGKEGGVQARAGGGGQFFIEPRGVGIRGGAGSRGAGAKYFLSGPKTPPSFSRQKFRFIFLLYR